MVRFLLVVLKRGSKFCRTCLNITVRLGGRVFRRIFIFRSYLYDSRSHVVQEHFAREMSAANVAPLSTLPFTSYNPCMSRFFLFSCVRNLRRIGYMTFEMVATVAAYPTIVTYHHESRWITYRRKESSGFFLADFLYWATAQWWTPDIQVVYSDQHSDILEYPFSLGNSIATNTWFSF